MATEEEVQKLKEEILSAKEPPNKGICWEEWDERENAIDSLEQVAEFLSRKYLNRRAKRVSMALSHTLYSFTICAVRGTNYERVLEKGGDLIGFWTSLGRVKRGSPYMGQFVHSQPIDISDEQKKNIEVIHKMANDFKHYKPSLNLTYLETFPQVVDSVVQVIKSIYTSGDFPYHLLNGQQKRRIESAFNEIHSSTNIWKEEIEKIAKSNGIQT